MGFVIRAWEWVLARIQIVSDFRKFVEFLELRVSRSNDVWVDSVLWVVAAWFQSMNLMDLRFLILQVVTMDLGFGVFDSNCTNEWVWWSSSGIMNEWIYCTNEWIWWSSYGIMNKWVYLGSDLNYEKRWKI